MKNDNNVAQVFVPATVLAKDAAASALVAGTIGFIDAETKLGVDKTNAADVKMMDIVMNTVNNGMISVNQIAVSRVNSVTKKAYSAGAAAKVTLSLPAVGSDAGAVIAEGEEIGVTFAIEAGDSYQTMGTNQIRKHFYVLAGSGATATATSIAASINADEESVANGGFMTATAVDAVVTVTFAFDHDDESIPVVGKIVTAVVSHATIAVNDNINGSLTPAFAFAQGKGKYIQRLESDAAGYNGGTKLGSYRYIPDNPLFEGFVPDAAAASNYDLYVVNFDLEYAQNSGYNDNYEVMVAAVSGSATSTAINDLFANLSGGKKIGLAEVSA